MELHWETEWDGAIGNSTQIHQLWKDGTMVAYIRQEPGEDHGAEYAYIRGDFRPVTSTTIPRIHSIKHALMTWARRGLI